MVVQGSGVGVIWGREFPIDKVAGRNASEPRYSLEIIIGEADPVA